MNDREQQLMLSAVATGRDLKSLLDLHLTYEQMLGILQAAIRSDLIEEDADGHLVLTREGSMLVTTPIPSRDPFVRADVLSYAQAPVADPSSVHLPLRRLT